MNDQVTLIGLNNFLDTYDLHADFEAGASTPGDVVIGLIEAATSTAEHGMDACDLIVPSEQCANPDVYLHGARYTFNIASSPLGLVIGYEGMMENE
ncbi:hypothetical protein I3F57_10355 [Lacticaseibacillus paracasei subsp. tolerans]|uniref:hypothetical protein n=1 Tax=Lacticaseibacillus paracasei TaxID=1597 RepID=UPI0018AD5689|nr:hypothetical protein [Lacticaseibacillus paracasei]QPI87323.1 hypothetical protein I3F57_10355 [Lacticaseibacillus paracasei subsp. tolerans]